MSKVWFITGASRGLGGDIARAALAAGDYVVATSRKAAAVTEAHGTSESLLALDLDVTKPEQAEAAVAAAIDRFGRIDVLVNNAGYSLIGALEECSLEEISAQFATNVIGVMAVTKAVLPTLRRQRSGCIFNITSSAGIISVPGVTLYCSTKFAVEGLSEGLAAEMAPLGVRLVIIEPGAFRTEFMTPASAVYARQTIDEYESTGTGDMRRFCKELNGTQGGDPLKLAAAIVKLADDPAPPLRFTAGEDAVQAVETMLESRRASLEACREQALSMALA